jgi:hypothetical protein
VQKTLLLFIFCVQRGQRGRRLPRKEDQARPKNSSATTDQRRADWQRQVISAARFNFKVDGGQTMKTILGPGMIVGLFLLNALSATGQTQGSALNGSSALPTSVHNALENTTNQYDYDFISKDYVWSNKPLKSTASKICQTMKGRAFSETPYGINGDRDWNNCLETQIRSIGYLRWLRNGGFNPNRKNRTSVQEYVKKYYTMGPWGSYSFAELSQAVKATTGKTIP